MKTILFGILSLGIFLSCAIENGNQPAEKAQLTGAITYQEAYTSVRQTDSGAEIYAVNETDIRSTKFEAMERVMGNFQFQRSNYFLLKNTLIDPSKIMKAQDNLDEAAGVAFKYIIGFRKLPVAISAAANGTGKYAMNLKPGRYYILVVSCNVKSNNIAESSGNIDFRMLNVKSSAETFLDVNFIRHERVITFAPVPAGC